MNLLAEQRVPPALVCGHREFLRPACRTDGQAPGRMLQHYAAELVRGPDGVWRVIADRTQAPAGAGYALQNRRVMSRVMGQALRQCRVRPLNRSEEHTSELQSLMRISYAVFCLKKKNMNTTKTDGNPMHHY